MNMSHLFERLRLMLAVLGSGFHSEKHSVFSWNWSGRLDGWL